MAGSLYGGMIFSAFAAGGGALEAQTPAPHSAVSEVALAADQSVTVGDIKAICAREDAEIISASADPASGTTLHLALVNNDGDFLDGGVVDIAGNDVRAPHLRLRCRGEWLMMKIVPGH